MALIVKKFGGTSVATLEKIKAVAKKVVEDYKKGHKIVVVVSAMGGETDRLESMALNLSETPNSREFDVLLATGEQVTISLLSMALIELGVKAKSYTGSQVKIKTNNAHNKARIVSVDVSTVAKDLDAGNITVVAGFQGMDENGNITTLGRGGSDTTAVALASALKADECQIFTDVDGVYTSDPRIVPDAKKMDRVTFEEMMELSSLGAKVLQIRAVELAGKNNVPVRVLSTFKEGDGTLISYEEKSMEHQIVSGIAFCKDEAKVVLRGVPDNPGVAGLILGPISDANIEVDMIVQNMAQDGTTDFTFTVHRADLKKASNLVNKIAKDISATVVDIDENIAKLSLVGVGMRSHAGIASKMFHALGKEGINIQLISTSEIKVSVLIDEKYTELGVRTLHDVFELGKNIDGRLTYVQ